MKNLLVSTTVLPLFLLAMTSCSSRSPVGEGMKVEWSYAELWKDENGKISETGNNASHKSAVDGQVVESHLWRIEVLKVEPKQATFRVKHPIGILQASVVEAGGSQELWLDDELLGMKIRVEKILEDGDL